MSRWPGPSTGRLLVHRPGAGLGPGAAAADGRRVPTTSDLGPHGERIAAAFLTDAGLRVLDRNWRCRDGEIDVVAREPGVLVFVEVKTRSGGAFGSPAEAVTATKARRLRRLAQQWLAAERPPGEAELRFDVVSVVRRRGWAPEVTHLRGAF